MNRKTMPVLQSLDRNAGKALIVAGADQDGSQVELRDELSGHRATGTLENGECFVTFDGPLADDYGLTLTVTKPVLHKAKETADSGAKEGTEAAKTQD